MPIIEVLQGLPASGKSQYARDKVASEGDWARVNKDDSRSMLHNGVYSPKREGVVVKARDALIQMLMTRGLNIVVDDTNLNPVHVERIKQLVHDHNSLGKIKTDNYKNWPVYHVAVKFFDIDLEEAVKRDLNRPVSVGRDVIEKMYFDWIFKPEIIHEVKGAPSAIISDMDGTLALLVNRGPYEHMKCEGDAVNPPVKDILVRERQLGTKIILMSGREDEARQPTENWLKANGVPYDALVMRSTGDKRSDDIIKLELFDEYVRDQFNVKFVIDDRLKVCRMWHKIGLFVFNVNQTNVRF
jgi:predicted kinase